MQLSALQEHTGPALQAPYRQPHPPFYLTALSPQLFLFNSQVTELSGSGGGGHGLPRTRSGKPPKLRKLVQLVEKATMNFVAVGEQIASENSDFQVCTVIDRTLYR